MTTAADRYVNSPDGLNLRAAPGGDLLRTLAQGDHLIALGQPTAPDARGIAWLNVKTDDDQEGWVAADYLSVPPPTGLPAPAAPNYVYVDSTDGLNLRAEKNGAAKIVTTLFDGQRLNYSGVKSGPDARGITWLNVKTDDGREGWVAESYVKAQAPAPQPVIPAGTGANAADIAANAADIAAEILRRTNELRQQRGVPPVVLNETLTQLALAHSQYMARSGNIAHTDASGLSGGQRIANAGFGAGRPVENIYGGQATVDDAWSFWINDPLHLDVLLNAYNTVVGIGVYKAGLTTYYTMDFGKSA